MFAARNMHDVTNTIGPLVALPWIRAGVQYGVGAQVLVVEH